MAEHVFRSLASVPRCNAFAAEKQGLWTLEVALMLYLCLSLGILCENHLIPSLELLCVKWSIPEDIAGSTILAVGASMPLLLINSFAKVEESDVGTAAIIGSVLFTITIGFSVICMVCGENDRIPSPSFSRDSTVLIILLGLLILFTSDKSISLADSAALIVYYTAFICFCLFMRRRTIIAQKNSINTEVSHDVAERETLLSNDENAGKDTTEKSTYFSFIRRPIEYVLESITPKSSTWTVSCLIISMIYLSLLSFLCVTLVRRISCILNLSESITGSTIVGIATSIPDIVQVYVITKLGHPTMAISALFGSCIFDLSIDSGIAGILYSVVEKKSWIVDASEFDTLLSTSIYVFASVIIIAISLCITNWRLKKSMAIPLTILYVLFLANESFFPNRFLFFSKMPK